MSSSAVSLSGILQQRLGDAHQDHAFLAGKPVLAHEGVDAGVLALVGARGVHEAARDVGGAAALVLGKDGALDQPVQQPRLVVQMVGRDLVARRRQRRPVMHLVTGSRPSSLRPCCPHQLVAPRPTQFDMGAL